MKTKMSSIVVIVHFFLIRNFLFVRLTRNYKLIIVTLNYEISQKKKLYCESKRFSNEPEIS